MPWPSINGSQLQRSDKRPSSAIMMSARVPSKGNSCQALQSNNQAGPRKLQQANQHMTKSIVCGQSHTRTTIHALLDRPADHVTQLSDLLYTCSSKHCWSQHSHSTASSKVWHTLWGKKECAALLARLIPEEPTLQREPEVEKEGVRCAVRQALRQRQRMAVARAQPRARPRPRQLRQHRYCLPAHAQAEYQSIGCP